MTARLIPPTLRHASLVGVRPDPMEQTPHVPAVGLGPVGRCPHRPTCTIFVPDSSVSVTGMQGNDPISKRFEEALLAIDTVARRCRCKREFVAIVHFDTPTSLDLAPTPLRQRAAIARALAVPADAAGQSLLGPALEAAEQIAETLPDHDHQLVVLSDFQLFDPDLDGLYERLRAFQGAVHALALRSHPPSELTRRSEIIVTHVTPESPRGALARAVQAALVARRPR